MINPTRTNLLFLKDKVRAVVNSTDILKARKQALIQEFLATTRPFLRSRDEIRRSYGRALTELAMAIGREGREGVESVAAATQREFRVEVVERSIWGLRYKDVIPRNDPVRRLDGRGYDEGSTTTHLEESTGLFERLLGSMLDIAEYESKLKRLGEEILRNTRRIKVLEEMILPHLRSQIRFISQYIGEREREAHYRLKKFKEIRGRGN